MCACFLPHSAALVGATDLVHNQTNSFHRQFSRQEELAVASRDIQVKTILRFHFFPIRNGSYRNKQTKPTTKQSKHPQVTRAEELALYLRAPTVLTEHTRLVPSTCVRWHTTACTSSSDQMPSSDPHRHLHSRVCVCACEHTHTNT